MHIIEQDGELRFYNSVKNYTEMEVGNYSLNYDKHGIFLKKECAFTDPLIAYDTDEDLINQVLVTAKHLQKGKNLGILLMGDKGQGKTFTARKICRKLDLPVIMINKSIPTHVDFVAFIGTTIQQDCIILVDEFEKNFPKYSDSVDGEDGETTKIHKQSSFLTLMDGVYTGPGNKIFLLSSNDEVDDKLINRPSRLRYVKRYTFIDPSTYDAIIERELIDKEMEKDLRENLPVGLANIDLLREIVSEINLQKLPYSAFKSFFNYRPKSYQYTRYRRLPDGSFDLKDVIETNEDINVETQRIAGVFGCRILDITAQGDIIYKVNERTNDEEGVISKEVSIYKLVKKIEPSPFIDTKLPGFSVARK